jgi:teichuronic acid biosynthesis glycosyltransferase TuaH
VSRECVLILSTADYDSAVWTNKQHVAQRLASVADVYYINSLGLRQPRFTLGDIKRIIVRLFRFRRRGAVGPSRPPRLVVLNPVVLPFHGYRMVRALNALLLRVSVVRKLPDRVGALWTFSPATYGLEKIASRVVYHSVDLLHTFPGIPGDWLVREERRLVQRADVVVSSSSGVQEHLRSLGRSDVKLWPNVADTALYSGASTRGLPRRPRALFAGNLTSIKVDFALLKSLADAGVEVAQAGPVSIDGSRDGHNLAALMETEGITYLGNLAPEELAGECAASMVGLIPYLLNDYTAGVYPMKLYEYLAAGLAVVSTALPSLQSETIVGFRVDEGSGFVQRVRSEIENFTEAGAHARRSAAMEHSWERRIADVKTVLEM